mgnify:CR=1 FL=1
MHILVCFPWKYRESSSFLLGRILCVAVSSDGKYILSGCRDGCIKVFDFESKKEKADFENIHTSSLPY